MQYYGIILGFKIQNFYRNFAWDVLYFYLYDIELQKENLNILQEYFIKNNYTDDIYNIIKSYLYDEENNNFKILLKHKNFEEFKNNNYINNIRPLDILKLYFSNKNENTYYYIYKK